MFGEHAEIKFFSQQEKYSSKKQLLQILLE